MRNKAEIQKIIEARIITGEYKIGRPIDTERSLASEFGVSKSVIHEVMISLRGKGLVESRARSKTIVADWISNANIDIFDSLLETTKSYTTNELARSFAEFRIFNEGKCAALAAQKRTDKDIALLRSCLEAIETAEDIEVFAKEITNLHHYIFNASGNKLYAVVFGAFRPVIENWNHYLFSDWKSYDSSAIKAIVKCIENRDAVAAECAMTVYTTESLARISRLRHMEIEKKSEDLRILD